MTATVTDDRVEVARRAWIAAGRLIGRHLGVCASTPRCVLGGYRCPIRLRLDQRERAAFTALESARRTDRG